MSNHQNEDNEQENVIQLAHGAGGILQEELIKFITKDISIKKISYGIGVEELDDGATIPLSNYKREIVVTSDGHTVYPLFFPGGDLGTLSICGTVNDLLVMGADPIALTSNFIIEEGFKFKKLKKIVKSFNEKASEAGIAIIAGDTKVMPRGSLSGIIISTSGIGLRDKTIKVADNQIKNGDKIILSGTIGDHGIALMAAREELSFTSDLESDVSLLTEIFKKLQPNIRKNHIHAMKDPTRGGIAGSLNDWAKKNTVSIWVKEEKIPIKKQVRAVSDMLGLDPFNIACEGKVLLAVDPDYAKQVLNLIKATSLGKEAQIIGEVRKDNPKKVLLETIVGGTRFVDMPLGEPIPRIC